MASRTESPYHTSLPFNTANPSVLHIDLNSCFASVEQQSNPFLRGKPIAVAASTQSFGCILAPSIEAKEYGIKVGMTVGQGKQLYPHLIVKESDPNKYRVVHHQFRNLLKQYTNLLRPKSIDEFVLYIRDYPAYKRGSITIAREIKGRIKQEIGEWLRVSVGISTNQVLAKLASGLNKPDGLDIIDHTNHHDIYSSINLKDLPGINIKNQARLNRVGIFTVTQMLTSSIQDLKSAFQSVLARYWYTRLRGWEIDDVKSARRSFGQSYVLPRPMQEKEWRPILAKLVDKAARRMRTSGYRSRGIHLHLRFKDRTHWHKGQIGHEYLFDPRDICKSAFNLYQNFSPKKPVKKIAVTCYNLQKSNHQLTIFQDLTKKRNLITSLDAINDKWGEYTLHSAASLGAGNHVRDAIAFGK